MVGMALFFWVLALIPVIIIVTAPNTRKSFTLVCILICLLAFPTSLARLSGFVIAGLPLILLKLEALRLHESGRSALAKKLPWLGLFIPLLVIMQVIRPEKFDLTTIFLWVLSLAFLAWCILIRFGMKFLEPHLPAAKQIWGSKDAKEEKSDSE